MTPNQKVTHLVVDVIVDRAVRRHPGAMAEVCRPTAQEAVQPISHLRPCSHVAGHHKAADFGLQPENALLRRARPEIPVALLSIPVPAPRVTTKLKIPPPLSP